MATLASRVRKTTTTMATTESNSATIIRELEFLGISEWGTRRYIQLEYGFTSMADLFKDVYGDKIEELLNRNPNPLLTQFGSKK